MSNWFCPKCGRQVTGRSGNAHEPGDKPLLCFQCEQPKVSHTPEQMAECAARSTTCERGTGQSS